MAEEVEAVYVMLMLSTDAQSNLVSTHTDTDLTTVIQSRSAAPQHGFSRSYRDEYASDKHSICYSNSVHVSVCLSVTLVHCVKRAKCVINYLLP